jgi:hypothetical protein
MPTFPSLETRTYPEIQPSCLTEIDTWFMVSVFLKASGGNKCHLIELDPNPKLSRRVFLKIGLLLKLPNANHEPRLEVFTLFKVDTYQD